jgi:hypothetical protein
MKTLVLIFSLAALAALLSEEPNLPRADDPLSKRMEGTWKGAFTSTKGAVFTIYRIHLGGRWQQTIIENSTGKMITKEGGTYIPPPDRGRFLVPEDVCFSSKGRADSIEKIKVPKIDELQLGDEGRMKPVIFKRIASAELPPVAALPPPGK